MKLYLWNSATLEDFECYQDDNGDCETVTDLANVRAAVATTREAAIADALKHTHECLVDPEVFEAQGRDPAEYVLTAHLQEAKSHSFDGVAEDVYHIHDDSGIVAEMCLREITIRRVSHI
jgi:hypothetical protein